MSTPESSSSRPGLGRRAALVIAFFMVWIPLLHLLPAVGPLPRIGPFEVEPFRAGMLVLSVIVVIAARPLGERLGRIGYCVDALVVAILGYASWRFYVDMKAMQNAILFFQPHQAMAVFLACLAIIYLTAREWGLPLALVALAALGLFFWEFQGAWVDELTGNMWLALDDGVLGNVANIALTTLFPFIILGSMLGATGAGASLIRISFRLMRHTRGGPAHAAILASGLFGTISGSSVANVAGTGVITIPMIKRRGFSPSFAGGVEATASTGGQIMPPIMGAAALVMADFLGINYLYVLVAALLPAAFYFLALFITVVFEARRLGIEASTDDMSEAMQVTRQDYVNLAVIGLPIGAIVFMLLRGYSPAGSALFGLATLIVASALNREIRRDPIRLVFGFAAGGLTFARLFIAVCAVAIVIGSLSSTGLPTKIALSLDAMSGDSLLLALVIAAGACILMGMGMPTLPAYLTIIVIMGSSMRALGIEPLAAHMFVFFFGVASAITPPVALTAFAAASISGGSPMRTGFAALRIGAVVFALPFFWIYNPMMLLVPQSGVPFELGPFLLILIRLVAMTYMLASAGSRFDIGPLSWPLVVLRLALGLLLIVPDPLIWGGALAGVVVVLAAHYWQGLRGGQARPALRDGS